MNIMLKKNILKFSKSNLQSERGISLIIALISIITLVTMIGYLINIGMNSLKIEDSRSLARVAALAGVKEYFANIKVSSDHTRALQGVTNGLNELANSNSNYNGDERFRDVKIRFFEHTAVSNNSNLPQSYGVVTPGKYDEITSRFTPATSIDANAAVVNAVKIDIFLGGDSIYNRFARSFLGGGGAVKRSSAIGVFQPSSVYFLVDISASSVAQTHLRVPIRQQESGNPRGGLFAVRCEEPDPADPNYINSYVINPSTSTSTKALGPDPTYCSPLYRPGEHGPNTVGSFGSQPAANSGTYYSTLTAGDYCLDPSKAASRQDYCRWKFIRDYHSGTKSDPGYYLNYDGSSNLPAGYHYKLGDSGSGSKTQHYINNFNEYNIVPPNLDPQFHPTSNTFRDFSGRFMVDIESMKNANVQPLYDTLKAIEYAITILGERGVAGDQTGAMFFERLPYKSRTVKLNTNLTYLSSLTAGIGTDAGNQRLIDYGIFPSDERYTDLGMALNVAFDEIMNSDYRRAGYVGNDTVIYIGDGLTNCSPFPNPELDADKDGLFDIDDIFGMQNCCWNYNSSLCDLPGRNNNPACSLFPNLNSMTNLAATNPLNVAGCYDNYGKFSNSIDGVQGILNSKYVPNKIRFHTIHIGKNAGAHVIGQSDGNGGCDTNPRSLRKGGHSPVRGTTTADLNQLPSGVPRTMERAYTRASENNPFFQAAQELYKLTSSTGGLYAPVLETDSSCNQVCDGSTRITCSNNSQQSQLQSIMEELIRDPDPFRLYDSD